MSDRKSLDRTKIGRRALLSIAAIACWIVLLGVVLSSVFSISNYGKKMRSKDRQSVPAQ
jgi:hypothetical protein